MSETTRELVVAMANGDASATEDAFQAAMSEKIASRLEDMRIDVAQSMFKTPEMDVEENETVDEGTAPKCPICKKPQKENTEGNAKYCPGH